MTREQQHERLKIIVDDAATMTVQRLAEKHNLSAATIRIFLSIAGVSAVRPARKPYTRQKPYNPLRAKTTFGDPPRSIWDIIDWSCQDTEIARVIRVSRERIRQIRRKRGLANSEHHHSNTATAKFLRWVKSHAAECATKTASEIAEMCGMEIKLQTIIQMLRDTSTPYVKKVAQQPTHPHHLMDWRLPNVVLSGIWNVSIASIANGRHRLRKMSISLTDGPTYESAHAQQVQAAKEWYRTPYGIAAADKARRMSLAHMRVSA